MSLNSDQVAPNERILEDLLGKWSLLRANIDNTPVSLAVRICKILQYGERYSELDMFLKALPLQDIYMKNEFIVRAKICVAFQKRDFPLLYRLIEGHRFQHGEDLIEIWDKAHYAEAENRTGKALTPLSRFRIRQRNMPPESICPRQERKKNTLPKESKDILQAWLQENVNHPYPSKNTKEYLARKTNLKTEQVKTWFSNARRRLHRARYNRLCHQSKGTKIRNKCSDVVANHASKSLVSGSNKTNHNENIEQDGVCAMDSNEEDLKKRSTNSDNTCPPVRMMSNADVKHNSEVATCRLLVELHTSEATGYHDERFRHFHNSDAADILPSIPPLGLAQPSVIVNPNLYPQLTYVPKLCTCSSPFPFDVRSTSYSLLHSNTGPPPCPYYEQNTPEYFEKELPSISTLRNPFQHQELFPIMTAPCEKEPIYCHQQLNALNQALTSPLCSGPNETRDSVVCGSRGEMMRFSAATALLDMSHKIHMRSLPSIAD